jgi:hypothetical protein
LRRADDEGSFVLSNEDVVLERVVIEELQGRGLDSGTRVREPHRPPDPSGGRFCSLSDFLNHQGTKAPRAGSVTGVELGRLVQHKDAKSTKERRVEGRVLLNLSVGPSCVFRVVFVSGALRVSGICGRWLNDQASRPCLFCLSLVPLVSWWSTKTSERCSARLAPEPPGANASGSHDLVGNLENSDGTLGMPLPLIFPTD